MSLRCCRQIGVIAVALLMTACSVKPTVISHQERVDRIQADWKAMFAHQPPIKKPMTIYDAMARAIKYNLDIRVKAALKAFAYVDAKVSRYNMLPSLVADAGYTSRNNQLAVKSPSRPGEISVAEDPSQGQAGLEFSWNALDFGLSYVTSKQKADRYLIAQERKRQIIQQVIRKTRDVYWRAWASTQMIQLIRPFIKQLRQSVNSQNSSVIQLNIVSQKQLARYSAELWDTYRKMNALSINLTKATPELYALLNIKPRQPVKLVAPNMSESLLPKGMPLKNSVLEKLALYYRPELREEDYRKRIGLNEVTKARLNMFPGLRLLAGTYYDGDSFLVNNTWSNVGARLSWDLLHIFKKYKQIDLEKVRVRLADMRRMAMSMAVITQVSLANLQFHHAKHSLHIAKEILKNRKIYFNHLNAEPHTAGIAQITYMHAKAEWILAKLRYYLAFAELHNAAGRLLDSFGYDPIYRVKRVDVPLDQLAHEIQQSLTVIPAYSVLKKNLRRPTRNKKSRRVV